MGGRGIGPSTALASLAALALAALLGEAAEGLRASGDAVRLLGPAGVAEGAVGPWETLPWSLPLDEEAGARPATPAALPLWLLAAAHRAAGLAAVETASLLALHLGLYAWGVLRLMGDAAGPWERWGTLAAGAGVLGSGLGGFFRAPYEEALALALLPHVAHLLRHPARWPIWAALALAAGLLGAKAYLPLLLPAVLLAGASVRRGAGRAVWAVGALAAGLLPLALRPEGPGMANAYNRLFNGLAYTEARVSDWPARDWEAREALAGERVGPPPPGLLAPALEPLWGTSFWPAALSLTEAERARAVAAGRAGALARRFADDPGRLAGLAREATLTAIGADYRLCYLRADRCATPRAPRAALGAAGLAFAAAPALAALALLRGRGATALAWAAIAAAPTAIALADGFYEFEKHLVLFPALALLLLPGTLARRARDP